MNVWQNLVGLVVCIVLGWAACTVTAESTTTSNWKPLFDGKALDGWQPVGDGRWVVEDGAICGKTDIAADRYGLLVSDKKYKNLKVRFKFKSVEGNSGFYIRGNVLPPDKAHGLQIEISPRGITGGIYESYGRGWISRPTAELVNKCYKPGHWNEMLITANAGDVVVELNGVKTAELKNDPVQEAGHFILQLHSGHKMHVMFKDIEVLERP